MAVGAGGLFLAAALGAQLRYGLSTFQRINDRMSNHFPSPSGDHAAWSIPETRSSAHDRPEPPAAAELELRQTQLEFVPRLRDYPWRREQPDDRPAGTVRGGPRPSPSTVPADRRAPSGRVVCCPSPGSSGDFVVFENSAHSPPFEEPGRFQHLMVEVLRRTDTAASRPVG
jgi:pimeloyl-ACP methyl ester carboxylesterase